MIDYDVKPPQWPRRFVFRLLKESYLEEIEGDLEERFYDHLEIHGLQKARRLYVRDTLKLLTPALLKKTSGDTHLNQFGMLLHNLKIGKRNLFRQKLYTLINLGGLVMGLSVTMLIALWIVDEVSFDKENKHFDRVAKVYQHQTVNAETHTHDAMPFPLSLELAHQYKDDFEQIVPSTWFGDYPIAKNESSITAKGAFMGAGAPEIMSLSMLQGTRESLNKVDGILLSKSIANALFGDREALGQTLKVYDEQGVDLIVTGVFEDISRSSSFHGISFIANWDLYAARTKWINKTAWNDNSFQLFVLLEEEAELDQVSNKIERIKYNNTPEAERLYNTRVFLHPMKDWHLQSNWENGEQKGGGIAYVWWFGIIGAFVLVLACVNFMNLSTAQSVKRAKEVGIRKSIGIARSQLVSQFLTESVLIVFVAFFISSVLVFAALPWFNLLTSKEIPYPFGSVYYWLVGLGFSTVVGLFSGSYPAIYLSSFNAIQVLKGTYQNALTAVFFRKVLVVFQFTISVALIIGTLVINSQIEYATDRPLGYDDSGTIMVEMIASDHFSKSSVIENELLASGLVTHFTQSSSPLTDVYNENDGFSWPGMDPSFNPMFAVFFVNHSYGNTIKWEVTQGRDFSAQYSSDSVAMIINEAALQYMQLGDPLDKKVSWFKDFKIIGVVKDMLVQSPFKQVKPAVYIINPGNSLNFMLMRLNPQKSTLSTISEIEEIFKTHVAGVPFKFSFVRDVHNKKFAEIDRIAKISQVFAVLAVLISCLGLFGLASFMVEQRTKEISIRKVLGAPFFSLLHLLSREFVLLVGVSCCIAVPLAFFGMRAWLQDYEYRTPLEWWIFVFSCIVTLTITMLTVGSRSIKVARANPAETLKDE